MDDVHMRKCEGGGCHGSTSVLMQACFPAHLACTPGVFGKLCMRAVLLWLMRVSGARRSA